MEHSKNILKEWDKIKDYDIFPNIDSFSKLFIDKPYGKCLKKYTNYPWCKGNFFFGTNEELNIWYKTTEEIPFYCEKYLNKKYGRLTIIGFKQIHNIPNKKSLHAICKCECGNVKELEFKSVQHGDYISCGCRRKSRKTSMLDIYRNIVLSNWDYDKNDVLPENIKFDSEEKYWWKGFLSSYLMAPKELLARRGGTSFPEQAILFYLKSFFPNIENGAKIESDNKKYEVDILLRAEKIAIEYDGWHWHKNKVEIDINKSNEINKQGFYLIRVRESGLEDFEIKNGELIYADIENLSYINAIADVINKIIEHIKNKFGLKIQKFNNLSNQIMNDKAEIEGKYLIGYDENCIANSWMSRFWLEKNKIAPYKVSINSTDRFWFRCHRKYELLISPKSFNAIYEKLQGSEREQFANSLYYNKSCPFVKLKECPCNALYHEKPQKACKSFSAFNKDNSLIKNIDYFANIDIAGDDNLRTKPFKVFKNEFSMFINSILDYNRETLYGFRKYISNLFFYRINLVNDLLVDFINLNIEDKIKQQYLENTLCYPYVLREEVARAFSVPELLKFFFENFDYNYMFKNEGDIILNSAHNYIIFDYIKCIFYEKKINVFNDVLKNLECMLNQEEIDIILKSLIVQIVIKDSYKFTEVKNSKKSFVYMMSPLLKHTSKAVQEEINQIISLPREEVCEKYVYEFIKGKALKLTLSPKDIDNLKEKLSANEHSFDRIINRLLFNDLRDNSYALNNLRFALRF